MLEMPLSPLLKAVSLERGVLTCLGAMESDSSLLDSLTEDDFLSWTRPCWMYQVPASSLLVVVHVQTLSAQLAEVLAMAEEQQAAMEREQAKAAVREAGVRARRQRHLMETRYQSRPPRGQGWCAMVWTPSVGTQPGLR